MHYAGIHQKTTSMKRFFIFLFLLIVSGISAQKMAKGNLKTTRDANLHVIRLQTDSFPQVAVTFHATDRAGNPVWNIQKEDVLVNEEGRNAPVIRLRALSEDNGLHSMLVIDHSGSMEYDQRYTDWLLSLPVDSTNPDTVKIEYRTVFDPVNPELYKVEKLTKDSFALQYHYLHPFDDSWYKSPLEYAQQASIQYINAASKGKDKVGLLGFSQRTDFRIPDITHEPSWRNKVLGMQANGTTAFYDAVDEALRTLVSRKGNRAVVALTDGRDNSSATSLDKVIALAQKLKIPVYVIGLGDVDDALLQRLAQETGGEYHHTNNAASLNTIFLNISKRIKAIYELVYRSPFLASATPEHELQLTFDVDSAFLRSQIVELPLPEWVVDTLLKRSKDVPVALKPAEAELKMQNEFPVTETDGISETETEPVSGEFPYGLLLVSVSVAGAGTLLVKSRKVKRSGTDVSISNIYPNPATGPVNIVYSASPDSGPLQLMLINSSGQTVYTETIDLSGTHQFDASQFPTGNYFVTLSGAAGTDSKTLLISH